MTRAVLLAAVLATAASGARAQVDTTRPPPPAPVPVPADTQRIADSTRRDSTARDTLPQFTSLSPDPVLAGPLPRGTRFTFNADSFAFSDTKTVSDLLARIPGVYVARGGLYGQAEIVLYGGRGPAALEVYWDGAPYLPVGRDSVYLDPGRIPLAPLERVDVIVLPATLRIYLVTRRQASTAPITEVGISTGQYNTSGYHGGFLKRWRSGLGLSLVADWNGINGAGSASSTTSFRDVDLWLKAEYVPSGKVGISYQTLSSNWNRTGNLALLVDSAHSKRVDHLVRFFLATRADGIGPRLDLTLATATVSRDSIGNRSLSQANLELSTLWSRASAAVVARIEGDRIPLLVEGRVAWMPFHPITLSADARHTIYSERRNGNRAHLAGGIALPFGFSIHGDAAWTRDLQAPTLPFDSVQQTTDLSGALRWERSWTTLEVGAARRDPFVPAPEFATGLRTITRLDATPATDYVTVHGSIRLLPGLQIAGWYFDPVRGGGAYEPPHYARYALTFYSKFWRVYRSGIFALRAEAAVESWGSGAPAGRDTSGAMTVLAGATFINVNAQIRIAGVTIFWANRNSRAFRGGYAPGVNYPRNYQFYGVVWRFRN